MTILAVDDDYESLKLLEAVLAAEGYEVLAADGGELALAAIAVRRPDLILLDLRMPGMDGLEVCRRIKESAHTRDIPLMFLSATGESADRVEGLRLGAVDFVNKPFQREELLARVRTHLELAMLRANLERQVEQRTAELRESEQRFRTMADAAPVMIWASGTEKSRTFFNKRWLEFTGRSLQEELDGGWTQNVHPDDRERCELVYSRFFDERRSFEIEYRLRRADAEYRWILCRGVPRLACGVFEGYIGSCIDITDLKQNQDRMVAAQKLESLGVMAARIAHDFGNLLGSILAETDLVLFDLPPGSAARESIERIQNLVKYASETVGLLMASAGAGVDSNALEPVDLSAVTEQMLRHLKVSISKRAEVRSVLPKDLPAICGNVAQIRQVVMNLITNASEALGGQPGFIAVTTEEVHLGGRRDAYDWADVPDGEYVSLRVSDTGCGMSEATRARIFDQFFTTKSNGRGLGLAAVYGIVRSHGGSIHVVSAPGAGATFEILFPCLSHSETSRTATHCAGRAGS